MNISRKTKYELFNAFLKDNLPFVEKNDPEVLLDLLNEIWDLRAMDSTDNRFSNAYDDIVQHTVRNDDWPIEYLLLERLNILDKEIEFIKFIESIVNIKYRKSEDDLMKYVLFINSYIEKDNLTLGIADYNEDDYPIYKVQLLDDKSQFVDLPKNKIPFIVVVNNTLNSNSFDYHSEPNIKPSFVLVSNSWDDYGMSSKFSLFFYDKNDKYYIGDTKITNGEENRTINILPKQFIELSDDFISLGQSYSYYENLKSITLRNFESVLFAIKDVAFFPELSDKFEKNSNYVSSLKRTDLAEKIQREVKYKIYDYDLSNLYGFKYNFTPKYSKDYIEVKFEFNSTNQIPNRVYAIIGKNGTGKTQLITKLPLDISNKVNENFIPRPPLFSKVIAVSYSIFDEFDIPKKTSSFNYVYCGLHKMVGNKRETLTPHQQSLRFHNTWKQIKKLERMNDWKKILNTFIDSTIVNSFIIEDNDGNLALDIINYNKIKPQLSSGQNIVLYIITEIVSNIRFNSLILFDEPETHLHPNAISQLMNMIYKLLEKFDSYCIIATHSPLIIREIFSKNVYVIDRVDNYPTIRKIGIETFGENLTSLTEEVFGNKEVQKHYKSIIDKLVNDGLDYDKIIEIIKSDNVSPSLNIKLYIQSKIGNEK